MAGNITVSKVDPDTGSLIPKTFPVVDCIPLEVDFSIQGITIVPRGYLWDFGDGTSSTLANPRHTYTTYGHHRVMLSVRDESGVWLGIDNAYVNLISLGKLSFTGEPRRGDKPLTVSFAEDSIAPEGYQYTGLQWGFGDTYGATGPNPSQHTYSDYGSYNVRLDAYLA